MNTISKNDAVSAKHGGGSTININAKEDGTILNPDNTVQIYGNLDAKAGTIRIGFSGKDSYWYGAGVGLINYDEATQTDRKSTRLNSSHMSESRMPSSA